MSEDDFPVALLLETESLRPHFHSALENMLSETNASIELIAVNNSKGENDDATTGLDLSVGTDDIKRLVDMVTDLRWSFIYKAEVKLAGGLGDPYVREWSETWGKQSIWEIDGLEDQEVVTYDPIHLDDEPGIELPNDTIEKITDQTEVVVNFDHSILKGDILTEPTHGVLSFHAGDLQEYRGRPAGFWQFLNDEDYLGVTLQQLTSELDGGRYVEIRKTDISDCNTFSEIKSRQVKLHPEMLSSGVKKIQKENFEPKEPDELGTLTYQSSEDELSNAVKMLVKNIKGRMGR